MNAGGGIRVAVSPTQAAYFAGETFSFTITFTNTNAPDATAVPRSASFTPGHHRAAHSISSAPLSKPPTSPGTPKTAHPALGASPYAPSAELARKGIVGVSQLPDSSPALSSKPYVPRPKPSTSLSVSVSPQDLLKRLGSDRPLQHSPSSPRISSPLARDPNAPPPPHVRKLSLQDIRDPPMSAASSSFALSLDPVREVVRSPVTPGLPSSPRTRGLPDEKFDTRTHSRERASSYPSPDAPNSPFKNFKFGGAASVNGNGHVGLGPPPASPRTPKGARFSSASIFAPPGTELLLWAYAQVSGSLELDESLIRPNALASLQSELRTGVALGGGSMTMHEERRARPSTGFLSSFFSSSAPDGPSSEERSMPTLESQPKMLAVDLSLAPGESRTYRYTTTLPDVLPPTFRGRAIKLAYTLVIGACRSSGTHSDNRRQTSRVMKIPIRLYNHVSVGRQSIPYVLMWPVARRRGGGALPDPVIEEMNIQGRTPKPLSSPADASYALEAFAQQLLSSDDIASDTKIMNSVGAPQDSHVGCKEAIEVITRNPRKLSFDVTKNNHKVAVLTFVKSAYRLGETVLGVVDMNEEGSFAKVLQVSVMLEAHESLPATWAMADPVTGLAKSLRRVHAEHHESLAPYTSRTAFSLNIPSDASPEFRIDSTGGAPGTGGVSWKIRLCLLVAIAKGRTAHLVQDGEGSGWGTSWSARGAIAPNEVDDEDEGTASSRLGATSWTAMFASSFLPSVSGGQEWDVGEPVGVETVECEVPIRVWPGNTAFKALDVVFDV